MPDAPGLLLGRPSGRLLGLAGALILLTSITSCGSGTDLGTAKTQDEGAAGGGPGDATTTMVEVRPSLADDEIPNWVGEVVNLHDLESGACFNSYAWVTDDRQVAIDTRVPCDRPHQHEIYLRTTHPARPGAPWPGDREMEAYARAECYAAFADFVGIIFELSELELGYLTPSRTDFEHDRAMFRGIHCFIHRSDGADLVGTAAGSRL